MSTKELRRNERIDAPTVRVVGEAGEQFGVKETEEARRLADEAGLDLVLVAPDAEPPVCKIMDYGKYMYEQSKKAKEAKKRQHVTHVKEVKMRPKIEPHDYDFKMRHARQFLEAGDKVKCTVIFRGRELAHKDRGVVLMKKLAEDLEDIAIVEVSLRSEGRSMVMVVSPKPGGKKQERGSKENAED